MQCGCATRPGRSTTRRCAKRPQRTTRHGRRSSQRTSRSAKNSRALAAYPPTTRAARANESSRRTKNWRTGSNSRTRLRLSPRPNRRAMPPSCMKSMAGGALEICPPTGAMQSSTRRRRRRRRARWWICVRLRPKYPSAPPPSPRSRQTPSRPSGMWARRRSIGARSSRSCPPHTWSRSRPSSLCTRRCPKYLHELRWPVT
mmetsp:Transcript_19936/g.46795  ORF Transcript_19936/g.46795 Transcript_19936/m.46795 type:complete len:201 (-) Transcript_19936:78-680(-)